MPEGNRVVGERGVPRDDLGLSDIPNGVEIIVILIDTNRWVREARILRNDERDHNCKENCGEPHFACVMLVKEISWGIIHQEGGQRGKKNTTKRGGTGSDNIFQLELLVCKPLDGSPVNPRGHCPSRNETAKRSLAL